MNDGPGPSGPWLGWYLVRILRLGSFIEALLWLWMRDYRNSDASLWMLWDAMARAMVGKWKEALHNLEILEYQWRVGSKFQRAWRYYCRDYPEPLKQLFYWSRSIWSDEICLLQLRDQMIKDGEFPSALPEIDIKGL
ncbi:hypothetical protein BDW59DRAFT_159357 [Aspergillus cavernicola]|uniref:Uncharacterized protein n=1 Tax=Aspergillus cavernicola TaxID=176166 RepID=A0ABR4IPY4_9EURO